MLTENPEFQKKLCSTMRALCLYSTFGLMAFMLVAVWFPAVVNPDIFVQVLLTYGILLTGSVIIQKIYTQPEKKN